MVARINTDTGIHNGLSYNELKAKNGQAELIAAFGYPKSVDKLSFSDKLNRLAKLAELNRRATIHGVHISLNFHPSELLSSKMLEQIASRYMDGIGFGNQPFLVYRHIDAGHPHIHIVSTNIQKDGSRISLHNIGRNQSEKTRKEIEQEFGLLPAGHKEKKEQYRIEPIPVKAVQYGKTETKKAIADVVREVVRTYKFTSLSELNAVLQLYNVMADRGTENSFLFKNNGLQYRITDKKGNKIGVPIKASTVPAKPTLKALEKKFQLNELLRKPHKETIRKALDEALARQVLTRQELEKILGTKKIQLVFRQNEKGRIYGITYIDHSTKCVFNGSDLGKEYSANAITAKLNSNTGSSASQSPSLQKKAQESQILMKKHSATGLLNDLIAPEEPINSMPLVPKKKKKKRKGPNN